MMTPDGVQYMSKDIEGLARCYNISPFFIGKFFKRNVKPCSAPAWEYDDKSEIRKTAVRVYEEMFDRCAQEKKKSILASHRWKEFGDF